MRAHELMLIGGTALLIGACASAPTRNDELEQARAEVQTLQQDPDAMRAAPMQLQAAQQDLQQADAAFANRAAPAEVTHLAFLARRQAEIGMAHTDEARAHDQLARANQERDRILLEARASEAARAQQQAQAAQLQAQQAQTAQQQAELQAQTAQQQLEDERRQLAELQTQQTRRGLELTLSSDLLFDSGSATLKPGGTLQLGRLADFMRKDPKTRIIVEGYTDSTGSMGFNQMLSQQRAQAVAGALEAQGVSADRIQTIGRGQQFPVASNGTQAGRQQNRRVDIVFSDMSGQFAQDANEGPALR
jgi:outer membrane protein OmpA-like peptidoglycan-associated protein